MNDIKINDDFGSIFPQENNYNSKNTVDFGEFIKKSIYRTDATLLDANESVVKLMKGEAGIHETMVKSSKASLSFNLMLNLRNKAMDSYKQIMQMSF